MRINGQKSYVLPGQQDKDNVTILNPITILERFIVEFRRDAELDAKKYEKQYFLERDNKRLEGLQQIYYAVNQLNYFMMWIELEKIMNELEKQDRQLSYHVVHIYIKPNGYSHSFIHLNPYTS